MTEGEGQIHKKPEFGKPIKNSTTSAGFFTDGSDLPLFSGTPIPAADTPFRPEEQEYKQGMLPGMPDIDLDVVRAKDRQLRHRRSRQAPPGAGDIFSILSQPDTPST